MSDECGDDGFSPEVRVSGSLVCHVDLDSLWMVHWENRRTVETGSHTGVSVRRRVLCSIARLSRLPVFPDTACLKYFTNIGKKCVLNLNAGETCTPIWSPECGLETVTPKPPFPHCRVLVVPSVTVAQVRGCTRMRGCAGNGHSPGETLDAREVGVSQDENVRGRLGLYKAGFCG